MSTLILAVKNERRKIFVSEVGLEWVGLGLHNRLEELCDLIGTNGEILEIQINVKFNSFTVKVNQDCKFFNEAIQDWSYLSKHSCELALKASLLYDLHFITLPLESSRSVEPYGEIVRDIYQNHKKNKSVSDFCLNECEKVKEIINTLPLTERKNAFAFIEN